eukprot:TRINITY_DN80404_c0_g1_i1.p1 TRINITY_DN80404_c0_g1~~TRINITY_DN80404_c0_g1_i1.p1  ORF type:complete len:215 (+),score=29.06 TRINITY_DN80404_c0_g1_i1:58-702(+)
MSIDAKVAVRSLIHRHKRANAVVIDDDDAEGAARGRRSSRLFQRRGTSVRCRASSRCESEESSSEICVVDKDVHRRHRKRHRESGGSLRTPALRGPREANIVEEPRPMGSNGACSLDRWSEIEGGAALHGIVSGTERLASEVVAAQRLLRVKAAFMQERSCETSDVLDDILERRTLKAAAAADVRGDGDGRAAVGRSLRAPSVEKPCRSCSTFV